MRFLEFVAVIGGADPEDPFEPHGKARHLAIGTLMLAIASWALLASMLAFHSNLHAPWPMAILGATLLASIVFLFDVIITVVPLKDDSVWSRVRVVLIRGLLSLAVGVVVSHATILFIYRDDLATMVTDSNNKKIEQITNETTASSRWTQVITQAQAQITKDQQRISSEDTTLDGARKRLDQLKAAWENDAVCVNGNLAANGDRCGQGPEANTLKQAYESYRDSAFPQAQTSHDDTVKAVQADIDAQNKTLNDANTKRGEEVTAATEAARHNLGLQAQNVALLQLLRTDWTAWLWPLFFLLIDIAVAFMKGVLPESAFDLKRRTQAPVKTMIDAALTSPVPPKDSSPQLTAVLERAAARQAEVAIAGIDNWADRQLTTRRSTARERLRGPRRQRLRFAGAATSLVVLAVVVSLIVSGSSGDNHASSAPTSDQSMQLRDGMTLSLPRGSISGSAGVDASYPAPSPWQDHTAVSQPVELSTPGQVVGAPELSIPVPDQLQHAAAAGGLQLAFRSADPTGWTAYPADYNAQTHRLSGRLTHFSTWQFWTWDWVGIGANISQTLGQLTGRRSADQPQCDTRRHPIPSWFNTAAGVTNDAAMVIRSCVQGHDGDDTLDVQIVNNRPYGMMLLYSGAPIAYGWHETATALPSGFRDLIGDLSVMNARGLYLPPLARASVGIKNIGNGKLHNFVIAPTPATITADVVAVLADKLLGKAIKLSSHKYLDNVFAAAAATSCAKMVFALDGKLPDQSSAYRFLTGEGLNCIKDILVIAGRNEIQQGAGMDMATIGNLSDWIKKLSSFAVGGWGEFVNKLGDLLDFAVDKNAAVRELQFGFSVLAHYTYTGPPTNSTAQPKPTTQAPPPSTPKQTPRPTPRPTPQPDSKPAPPHSSVPAPPTPDPARRVLAYDNYGPVTTAGTAMCAGNPSRPESVPSGTVTQRFVVGPGIAYLDTATVQIDRNVSMTVHATLAVNGVAQSTNDQTPNGDTVFTFGRTAVHQGDQVTLTLTWSGTAGKLDTIYTTGNPPNSHVTISNTCPDYGSTYTMDTDSTGLRATVSGWSA